MATTELLNRETVLKEGLKRRIDEIHDDELLCEATLLLGRKVYPLSPKERTILDAADRRLDEGKGLPDETVQDEIEKWFESLEKNVG